MTLWRGIPTLSGATDCYFNPLGKNTRLAYYHMRRLFVAIKVPETVQSLLHAYQPELTNSVHLLSPKQFHITLHFIGNVDNKSVQLIDGVLSQVNASPFLQHLSTLGTFFRKKESPILWAGVEKNNNLRALHQSIGEVLSSSGVILDKREYFPHITLAKIKRDGEVIHHAQTKGASFEADFEVQGFSLFESRLTAGGAMYKEIKIYRFY